MHMHVLSRSGYPYATILSVLILRQQQHSCTVVMMNLSKLVSQPNRLQALESPNWQNSTRWRILTLSVAKQPPERQTNLEELQSDIQLCVDILLNIFPCMQTLSSNLGDKHNMNKLQDERLSCKQGRNDVRTGGVHMTATIHVHVFDSKQRHFISGPCSECTQEEAFTYQSYQREPHHHSVRLSK